MNSEENADSELNERNTQQQIKPRDVSTLSNLSGFKEVEDFPKEPPKKSCTFPTAYSILLIIELIVFILTYIIPKGLYDKLSYSSEEDVFTVKLYNGTIIRYEATQYTLDDLEVKIPLLKYLWKVLKVDI